MSDLHVIEALQTSVIAAVAASAMPHLPIAYVDVGFTKPDDGKWLEVVIIPNNDPNAFWGEEKRYLGIVRLILHWPKTGAGVYAPITVLKSITDFYAKDRLLSGVQVYAKDTFTGSLPQDSEVLYPATLRYTMKGQ